MIMGHKYLFTFCTSWLKIATCLSWSVLLVLSAAGQPGFQQAEKKGDCAG
jgi:hypothetical protein